MLSDNPRINLRELSEATDCATQTEVSLVSTIRI